MIADTYERQQAIDPQHSYIVQAPAGSGKTELLIQRLLTLLTRVNQPEAIIAITFTRKAAAEMQERILATLQQAQALTEPIDSFDQPQRHRLTLAQQVLQRDRQLGWYLLTNPQRLRIQTIDSLCHYLVSRLPITARLGAPMAMTDQPDLLYQQAVQSLITHYLDSGQPPALADLFSHLNHQFEFIETLLIQALQQRDQWLSLVHQPDDSHQLRTNLETSLQTIVNQQLMAIDQQCQAHDLKTPILHMMQQASSNCDDPSIHCWANLSQFPRPHYDDLHFWHGIAQICLTQKNEVRQKVTKKQGFPAGSNGKDSANAILDYLKEQDDFKSLISNLKQLPKPVYQTENWRLLQQLLTQILPQAAAHLQLIFQKQQTLDFQEVAIQALNALGTPDQASDLLLALDYQLEHILVDEFQDTAYLQINLLEKLTADWAQTPHKTLFFVGDPMQSIYRFRNAEVNIFLQLWQQQTFNDIPLTPLQLQANFRSSLQLVEWLNQSINTIFPDTTDINSGAVPGVTAEAVHDAQTSSSITSSINNEDSTHEAQNIIQQIQHWQHHHPDWQIAILVQKRSQMADILPALQTKGIAYQSQDLLPLTQLSIIQDLIALTRALYCYDDRTAWLACLRAPWCGLTKRDLTLLAKDSNQTIWQLLHEPSCWQTLSTEAQQRIQHWCQAIYYAQNQYGRIAIAEWIYNTWQQLSGPSCLRDHYQHQASQQFFDLLRSVTDQSDLDLTQFQQLLSRHYLSSPQTDQANVHIMTIHKAKGLEFDAVIVPSLQARRKSPDPALFLWSDYYLNGYHYSLLAPIKRSDQAKEDQPLYQFINNLEKQRLTQENKRLLYVALTRAKSALHLTAHQSQTASQTSFLNYLDWEQADEQNNNITNNHEQKLVNQPMRRLKAAHLRDHDHQPLATTSNQHSWQNPEPRLRGSLIHFILQIISDDWQQQTNSQQKSDFSNQIKALFDKRYKLWLQQSRQLGLHNNPTELVKQCQNIIYNVAHDTVGQWLLAPKSYAINEMSLAVAQTYDQVNHYRPDRVFFDNNAYWVIDYKTTADHTQGSVDAIWQKYHPQLEHYQQLLRKLWHYPIHKGIYLPISQTWLYDYDA